MTKEQLAEQYAEGKSSSSVFQEAHKRDFLAGYDAAVEKIKGYLFNTAESQDNITEECLKQTIKF